MNEFYENKILKEVLESSLFSLDKRRNIIIVGEYGIGKSHIAREIAKIFNLKNKKNENNFCHFICTEETKCSDLIGSQTPQVNGKDIYMEWKEGFLTKAIENGELVILDNLQEANSTITERLNGLLDIKYDEGKNKGNSKKFDVPENPIKNSIKIHQDFRIIGICDISTINQMSPAFLNRFDIIILENQLNNLSEEGLTKLLNIIINKGKEQSESTKKILEDADQIFGVEEENEIKEEENNINEILDIKTNDLIFIIKNNIGFVLKSDNI
jgi:MoxR-like ATPase